jgi:tetratricopeptide (TPR) repeat protein
VSGWSKPAGALVAAGLALTAVGAGDPAAALTQLETALAAAPDDLRLADEYRRTVIAGGEYDRALAFFERLTAEHPDAANAWLNYGYALVDKIPAAGSITRVILANAAIDRFGRSIELRPSWIAVYTRGNSYLYWPEIFGRAPLAVADLERAIELARRAPRRIAVHVRSWIALGDCYWKTDRTERARAVWSEGLSLFPGDPELEARMQRDGEALDSYLAERLDPAKRVDTSLDALWSDR